MSITAIVTPSGVLARFGERSSENAPAVAVRHAEPQRATGPAALAQGRQIKVLQSRFEPAQRTLFGR